MSQRNRFGALQGPSLIRLDSPKPYINLFCPPSTPWDMTAVDQLHATEAAYRDSSCISSNGNDLTVLGGWAPGALSLETKLPRITNGNPERILPRPGCERPLAQTPISCRRVPRGNSSDEGLTQTDYYPLRRSSVTLCRRKPSQLPARQSQPVPASWTHFPH